MRVVGIIPARFGSMRLPGKPLVKIGEKTLIEHVWHQASKAKSLNKIIVATDDQRIVDEVKRFGGEAVMTPADCASGTDRIAKVVERVPCDVVVNIQGDEPFLLPRYLDKLVDPFQKDRRLQMATLAAPLPDEELHNPNSVKVVCDQEGYALYFSRAPIPFQRDQEDTKSSVQPRLHLGVYAYHRSFLIRFAQLKHTPLEKCEKLEQLRALEHGIKIKVVNVSKSSLSIDTEEDLKAACQLIETRKHK